MQDRVDKTSQSVQIAASAFVSGSQKVVAYGHSGAPNERFLDGDTVLGIGSITKVFTALLLAEMVTSGRSLTE